MTHGNTALRTVLAVGLALAVLSPSLAVARPGGLWAASRKAALASTSATGAVPAAWTGRNKAKLEARIATALKRRAARFDRTSNRLTERLARVSSLADKIAASGGDVSEARSLLDSAKVNLGEASDLEAKAAEQFRGVSSASNRRAAFSTARATARTAIEAARRPHGSAGRDYETALDGGRAQGLRRVELMTWPRAMRIALATLLIAALQPVVGCGLLGGQSGSQAHSGGSTTGSVVPTSSASASGTVATSGTAGADSGAGSGTQRRDALSTHDAQAIDAELDAVQRELERLDMPTDGDFDDISKGLE